MTRIIITRTVESVAEPFLTRLRTPAPRVRYPIAWKSIKQRKAFFASNGFGRGIPTQRTGALPAAWSLSFEYTAGGITIATFSNPTPYLEFVQGTWQQPMHINTGWINYIDEWASESIKLEDAIETNLLRLYEYVDKDVILV